MDYLSDFFHYFNNSLEQIFHHAIVALPAVAAIVFCLVFTMSIVISIVKKVKEAKHA